MPRRNRKRTPPSPLPPQHGVDPMRIRTPAQGTHTWPTLRDHLVARLPADAHTVDAMIHRGEVVDKDGRAIGSHTPYAAGTHLWFHRDLPAEPPVPFPIHVVYRDERLLVADKPHFLATTPRGRHVAQTALARLRHELDLPGLSPAHRLDRLTAGLVMFTVRPEVRGAYQLLFQQHRVYKEYEALAPYRPDLELPRTVRSHIEKTPGVMAARELPDRPINAESRVELLDRRDLPDLGDFPGHAHGTARYRLLPRTGRTHQLRVHMNTLGIPILGDPVYPEVGDPDRADFSRPLQLLARVLEFTDPVTGARHRFETSRTLTAWDDPAAWAAQTPAPDGPAEPDPPAA
ncbi:pseudouridylate synthase [Streptomyces triticagri]|uniref:RNA pseudouridylate synthase n=1 Tax=Streptomyces triticagri TaxID=2293568 RepID=A0A372M800_9ACTN|nr:pseudouridine synthase [Streptomyces triticagri]RFU87066.1 pseudouridylate synthase [Streptomyces triticagri]